MDEELSEDTDDELQAYQPSEIPTDNLPVNEPVSVPHCTFVPCDQLKSAISQKQSECGDDPKACYLEAIDACGQ